MRKQLVPLLLGSLALALVSQPASAAAEQINTVVATIPVGSGPSAVAFSPDGSKAYVGNSGFGPGGVSLIDTATLTTVGSIISTGGPTTGVAVSPDGQYLYAALFTGGIVELDAITGAGLRGASVDGIPFDLVLNPGGTIAYLAAALGGNNAVSKVQLVSSPMSNTAIALSGDHFGLALAPDGSFLYVTNSADESVSVIDTSDDTVTTTITTGPDFSGPYGVAVSPDGSYVLVANEGASTGNTVSVIDTSTNLLARSISVGSQPVRVEFAPSGEFAYVTNSGSDNVSVIRMSDLTVTDTIPVGDNPSGIAVSPNGEFAYVTNYFDNTVSVIRLLPQSIPVNYPTAPLQQFGVPANTQQVQCADLAPDSVNEPGIAHLTDQGWSLSWAQWVNNGSGGPVCSRQPYYNGLNWSVR